MLKYIGRRIVWLIPVMLGVILIIFTLLYFTRGDPARIFLGADATEEEVYEWHERYGLNDGYFVRLARYIKEIVVNQNLGTSYKSGASVSGEIWARFKVTLVLAAASLVFEVLLGVGFGIISATHQDTPLDRLSMVAALVGASVPGFAVALIFSLVFALKLRWFPPSGWGALKYLVLPVAANMIAGAGSFARQTRSAMLEVIRADYITTARAKGISTAKVVFKHELKSALIPVITAAGSHFGRSLGGTVVIESVFGIPGLGAYMVSAINQRDYPAVQGSVLFMALAFSIVMLLVDIIYALVDPRIRARFAHTRKRSRV